VAQTAIVPVVDEGLGNSAYLVDLGDGRALAVDVPRDLRAVRSAASGRRLTIAYAADTHLHADFLCGARQLAADDGAQILASAAAGGLIGTAPLRRVVSKVSSRTVDRSSKPRAPRGRLPRRRPAQPPGPSTTSRRAIGR